MIYSVRRRRAYRTLNCAFLFNRLIRFFKASLFCSLFEMPKSRSTEELEQLANITVDHNIPVKLYFRSAELLLKQARVYKLENDLEHAYILYMKYTK